MLPRLFFLLALLTGILSPAEFVRLEISPPNPMLFGKASRQRLVVIATRGDGSQKDVTADALLTSETPAVAAIAPVNVLQAETNGATRIRARFQGLETATTALVQRAESPAPASFAADILPVLTKMGCNGGSCHGALNGQAGFKLSLFGYDPESDWKMIVQEHSGRRLNLQDPAASLLLKKPTFDTPHGGGKIFSKDSAEYRILLGWLQEGAKRDPDTDRRMVSLRVEPGDIVLYGKETERKLLVTARLSDGTEADVSHLVKYESNNDSIASVTPDGVVKGLRGGETAVMVRGPGVVGVTRIGVVLEKRQLASVESFNFIDDYVFGKMRRLHIPASPVADDATYLRRVYLNIIGVLPSAEEAKRFLSDTDPKKREKIVDELLNRPEYADNWALYWGDHLHNTKQLLYNAGPYTFTRWLYKAFRQNWPYDKFVRELVTSSGNMYDSPATSFYPLMNKPLEMASVSSQLFLGVRLDCARCHNHPLEKWTQEDYNSMAAFFGQVSYKGGTGPRNNERTLYVKFDKHFQHPDTKQIHFPRPLGETGYLETGPETDRREVLADWMISKDNPFFAKTIVNRYWKQFMGRGLVDPVDDFRVTNPCTHPELLDALAKDFAENGWDLHHLIKRITSSRAYQLDSTTVPGNEQDTTLYSHYLPRRLSAEQMLDSLSKATGVHEQFTSLYPGTTAAQLPEPEIESYFLDVFDRPSRQLVCDRKETNSLNQALHLVSGEAVSHKIADPKGFLARVLAEGQPTEAIVDQIVLRSLARYPDAVERKLAQEAIARAGGNLKRGLEDFFWAVLNSKEFLYNH